MASKHLDDPLDYLYEELSDAGMAEVRRHLAECPQCREEVARIRETVKCYRSQPRPRPPSDLAKRTAAALRTKGAAAEKPAVPPEGAPSNAAADDPQFENLKAEVRGELQSKKRKWLFHPAWPVAASVVFVFAVLYHLSPRRPFLNGGGAEMSAPPEPAVMRETIVQERRWVPLPESVPRVGASPVAGPAPTPALGEAEAWESPPPADARFAPTASARAEETPLSRINREGENLSASDLEALDALLDAVPDREPIVINLAPEMEPPRLAPRPPEIDVEKLVGDLIFMAGMQLGSDELAEAGVTIDLLRKYDPGRASELDGMLRVMLEEKARREPDAADAEKKPVAAPDASGPEPAAAAGAATEKEPVVGAGTPDKYFFAPEHGAMTPNRLEPAIAPSVVEDSGAFPDTNDETDPEPVAIPEPAERTTPIPVPETVSRRTESPAAETETASRAAGRMHDGLAVPARDAAIETPPIATVGPDPAIAGNGSNPFPGAVPPALRESVPGFSCPDCDSIAPAREPGRRVFTTDPYYRDR